MAMMSEIFAVLAEQQNEKEVRTLLGDILLRLLHADQYASFFWNEAIDGFTHRVAINMSDTNLSSYETYYQFHDPITHQLRERMEPTLVTDIMPQSELLQTEFFNDFLNRDGLFWGVNLHVRVAGERTGDLRIWRGRRGGNFDGQDLAVLRMIAPAFRAALGRCSAALPKPLATVARGAENLSCAVPPSVPYATAMPFLTEREKQVAHLVATGLSDKEISRALGIAFTTVRAHLKHTFRKFQVDNRVKLAARFVVPPKLQAP